MADGIRLQNIIQMNPRIIEWMLVTDTRTNLLTITTQDGKETVYGEKQFELSKEDIKFLSSQFEFRHSFLE